LHFSLLLLVYIEHTILEKPLVKHPAPFKMPPKKKRKMQGDVGENKLAKALSQKKWNAWNSNKYFVVQR
jgi:hypothetical protein